MAKNTAESGGKALQQAIHVARAKAGIPSDAALARVAHVSYDTLMNWFSNATRPRGAELQRVATALDVPYAFLDAVYEGRPPDPQPLEEAVAELTVAIRDLVLEIREDRERGQDAAAAILQAAAALRLLPNTGAGTTSTTRAVPRGTEG